MSQSPHLGLTMMALSVMNACILLVAVHFAPSDSGGLSLSVWSQVEAWLKEMGHGQSSTTASVHFPYASTPFLPND